MDEQARYDERISVLASMRAARTALLDLDAALSMGRPADLDVHIHEMRTELAYAQRHLVLCFGALSEALGNPKQFDSEAPNIELAMAEEVCNVVTRLRGFATDLFEAVEGFEIQDIALKHGLLVTVTVTEPCGEHCICAECDEFPLECYRKTSLLTGNPDDPKASSEVEAG